MQFCSQLNNFAAHTSLTSHFQIYTVNRTSNFHSYFQCKVQNFAFTPPLYTLNSSSSTTALFFNIPFIAHKMSHTKDFFTKCYFYVISCYLFTKSCIWKTLSHKMFVIFMLLISYFMIFLCYLYLILCYFYVTYILFYDIFMLLISYFMLFLCYLYLILCYFYVTYILFYVIFMLLISYFMLLISYFMFYLCYLYLILCYIMLVVHKMSHTKLFHKILVLGYSYVIFVLFLCYFFTKSCIRKTFSSLNNNAFPLVLTSFEGLASIN